MTGHSGDFNFPGVIVRRLGVVHPITKSSQWTVRVLVMMMLGKVKIEVMMMVVTTRMKMMVVMMVVQHGVQ